MEKLHFLLFFLLFDALDKGFTGIDDDHIQKLNTDMLKTHLNLLIKQMLLSKQNYQQG